MSTVNKAAGRPCRIPTFGTRIPLHKTPTPSPTTEITTNHLGRAVRVSLNEGVLKFFGPVHFAKGTWCGIELNTATGKNNGSIDGVRYFECPEGHGLMAPAGKVTLVEDNFGPFSILCLPDKPSKAHSIEDLTKVDELQCNLTYSAEQLNQKKRISDTWDSTNKTLEKIINDSIEAKRRRTFDKPNRCNHDFEDNIEEAEEWPNPNILLLLQLDEDNSKRDSLDIEESLGILTPDQMVDFSQFEPGNLTKDEPSITEYSLGLIDPDQLVSGFTMLKSDTTMNLELPLDPADSKRCEETPSPEELPLDTLPILECELKTEPAKSKTNSFITSITSITSLDTGYQGDGEMSRPASRGADNSPLTRRPFPRPLPRRPDPMTDSDFYTESDADNHEDNHKGDRRAQVIDGTLYGVDPQAAADIYVNNRENMDSSGVFTDIESGPRNEEDIVIDYPIHPPNKPDISPSESTKTISENSQNNLQEVLQKTKEPEEELANPKKRNAPSPASFPSTISSPRHKEEVKKFKIPKREIPLKVKNVPNVEPQEKKLVKKPVNRWDAVMNKISKSEQKTNLKEVKSKVFENVKLSSPSLVRSGEARKNSVQKRIRTRTPHTAAPLKKTMGSSSSLSDATGPPKKPAASTKKRDQIQVTQVLTANKLSSKNQQNLTDIKKNATNLATAPLPAQTEIKKRTNIFATKDKKQVLSKESKPSVKGGRTSPSVRTPVQQTPRSATKCASKTVEALAVLVQHLVFNVGAYDVPHLKRQVEKLRSEAEEVRLAYQSLKDAHGLETCKNANFEKEKERWRCEVAELILKHQEQIAQITAQHSQDLSNLRLEKDQQEQILSRKHQEQLATLKQELEKLQKSHEEALDILREENDCIRDELEAKRMDVDKVKEESEKLKLDYETKEIRLMDERDKVKIQLRKMENAYQEKLKECNEENRSLREQNDRILDCDDQDVAKKEVHSLRVVLEFRQNEITELRKALEEMKLQNQILEGAEEKAASLQSRLEDLQHQLYRKSEYEKTLIDENKKLQDAAKKELNQSRRLSQHNEELQWKLRQNKEVMTKVIEQATEEQMAFNRSHIYSSSFNEKYSSPNCLQRTLSFRECTPQRTFEEGKRSNRSRTPSIEHDLPNVKGVVEKSDSVSYVLDLDESPDLVASRILRRSFRNTTPPKTTPSKSPSNKRARIKSTMNDRVRTSSIRSAIDDEVFHWDNEEEVELELPALPNEMDKSNGVLTLPRPQRLANDAGESDSTSEDESTSSSQL